MSETGEGQATNPETAAVTPPPVQEASSSVAPQAPSEAGAADAAASLSQADAVQKQVDAMATPAQPGTEAPAPANTVVSTPPEEAKPNLLQSLLKKLGR